MLLRILLFTCFSSIISAIDITTCTKDFTFLNDGDVYNIVPKNCTYAFYANTLVFSTISATIRDPDCSSCITITWRTTYGDMSYAYQYLVNKSIPPTQFWIAVQPSNKNYNITVSAKNPVSPVAVGKTATIGPDLLTIIRGNQLPINSFMTVTNNNNNSLIVRVAMDPLGTIDFFAGLYIFSGKMFLCSAADIYTWQNEHRGPLITPLQNISFLAIKNLANHDIRTTLLIGDSNNRLPVDSRNIYTRATPTYSTAYKLSKQNQTTVFHFLSYEADSSETVISSFSYTKDITSQIEIYAGCVVKQLPKYLLATIKLGIEPGVPLSFRGPCKTIIFPENVELELVTSIKNYTDEQVELADAGSGYIMSRSYPYADTFKTAYGQHNAHITSKDNRRLNIDFDMFANWINKTDCVNFKLDKSANTDKSLCPTVLNQASVSLTASSVATSDVVEQASEGYLLKYKYTSSGAQLGLFAFVFVVFRASFEN